jgi:pimeloyl-ACP methyl ester carboxylesterase
VTAPPRRSFASEQGEIRWDVVGTGPPVVLTHGTPFSSLVWREVAAALAPRHQVYVWDLAGFGASAREAGQDVSIAAQARILADLTAHWDLHDPVLVGHDLGGAVTLRAVLREGVAAGRLALVDAVAVAPWGSGFFRLAQQHADVLRQLPDPVHDGLVRGYVRWAAHRPLPDATVEALAAPWSGAAGRDAFYRQIVQNGQHLTDEVEPHHPELAVPTLLVWGREDPWVPVDRAHRLASQLPDAQLRVVDDVGHLLPLEAPAVLAVELAGWLARPP